MEYQPITCVWEVTMGCNMRCGHCGSSCSEPLPDELNTNEALVLCDQIADLGVKWVTLSGGEPLTRKDLPMLVERLHNRGVSVNVITNGWLMKKSLAELLKEKGIKTAAISVDGTEKIHDAIRKEGAYAHVKSAFQILKSLEIQTGAVTTITKQNLPILDEMKQELIGMGVDTWQVQLGLPMGNLKEKPEWILDPEQIEDVINFCYETALEGKIRIFPADCIGYYTKKEMEVKKISYRSGHVSAWDGCNAGIRSFGILQNGDILGCTSIRSKEYIEGNIRSESLRRIWEDDTNFLWRRSLRKEGLTGLCSECVYGSKCLGGCPNTRLTINGSMDSSNQYCSYYQELLASTRKYEDFTDEKALMKLAQELIGQREYQEASFVLRRILKLSPNDKETLKAKGFTDYMCGNYKESLAANEKAVELDSNDAYALRGYGCVLYKTGDTKKGVEYLRKAVALTGYRDADMLHDLEIMEASLQSGGK